MNWNLKLLYDNEEDLKRDFESLDGSLKAIKNLKGKLSTYDGLKNYMYASRELNLNLSRLYSYYAMQKDMNQKNQDNVRLYSTILNKYYEVISELSFIEPEIMSYDEKKIMGLIDEELEPIRFSLKKMFDSKKHIKSEEVEGVIANYNSVSNAFSRLYDNLSIVDCKPVKVKLSDGTTIEVTKQLITFYLATLKDQKDRKKVFEAIYKYFDNHKETYASIYDGMASAELAYAKSKDYKNILSSHLDSNNIPEDVYLSLIKTTKKNTAPIKKYYELRKKYFNLKSHHTYDRFLKFKESKVKYTYDESKRMVLEATKRISDEYANMAKQALEDGRVDVYPVDGKYNGAYSTGAYDRGSFILLNHTDDLNSAFTLAHECGHSIHTLYANSNQAPETADYTIFVAEVASTFNEALFLDYLLDNTNDKDEKICLLQEAIDGILATYYRQSLFADFEYQAHKLKEEGKTLDSEILSDIFIKLYKTYYGINIRSEKYKQFVWAYIPHFYHSPYYVYQYATSYSASSAIYEKVKSGDKAALDAYLNMLKSGGSDYPIELLKKGGCDLTSSEPFLSVVRKLENLVNRLEELLNENL